MAEVKHHNVKVSLPSLKTALEGIPPQPQLYPALHFVNWRQAPPGRSGRGRRSLRDDPEFFRGQLDVWQSPPPFGRFCMFPCLPGMHKRCVRCAKFWMVGFTGCLLPAERNDGDVRLARFMDELTSAGLGCFVCERMSGLLVRSFDHSAKTVGNLFAKNVS